MDAVGVQQAVEVAAGLGQLRVGGETGRADQQGQLRCRGVSDVYGVRAARLGGVGDLLVEAVGGGVRLVGHGGAASVAGVFDDDELGAGPGGGEFPRGAGATPLFRARAKRKAPVAS